VIDSDVLIWYLRGNKNAKDLVDKNIPFTISAITYMELIQGMKDKRELSLFKKYMEKQEPLITGNEKHYRFIPDIQLKVFKP